MKKYYEFEFTVEDMTPAEAEELMTFIVRHCEGLGLSVGGGCHPTTDDDYEEDNDG